jgi:membrane protein
VGISVGALKKGATSTLARRREQWGWFDHLLRAWTRYREDLGDRLAAAVTYYGFLSLFPILLLGLSILGYVLAGDPDRQLEVFSSITSSLPGVGNAIVENLRTVMENRGSAGLVGLVGLAFSGLGWIDALREALRAVWHQPKPQMNIVKRKLVDILVLAGLGVTVFVSLAVGVVGAGITEWVLGLVGLDGSGLATVTLAIVAYAFAIVADTMLFAFLFYRLPAVARPKSRVFRGAVFGAVGFNILKLVGTVYIGRTVSNGVEVYGTFAVVVGLLIWINLVSRFVLFSAAWTVTGQDEQDVAPSGTADDADGIPSAEPSQLRKTDDGMADGEEPRADPDATGSDDPYPGHGRDEPARPVDPGDNRADNARTAAGAIAGAGVGLLVVNALRGRREDA